MAGDPAAALESALRLFIRDGASRPFDWLTSNCGFWVCEWIAFIRGVDPVADLRCRFRTATGFKRHVLKAGGNEPFSRAIANRAGLAETEHPRLGDVGLIETERGPTMAINVGEGKWAAKSEGGIVIASFRLIVAWAL